MHKCEVCKHPMAQLTSVLPKQYYCVNMECPMGGINVPAYDAVHPDHYKKGGIEPFDVMRATMTPEQFEGFLAGNVIKYMMRYRLKNGIEDLKKAEHYISVLIEEKEKTSI